MRALAGGVYLSWPVRRACRMIRVLSFEIHIGREAPMSTCSKPHHSNHKHKHGPDCWPHRGASRQAHRLSAWRASASHARRSRRRARDRDIGHEPRSVHPRTGARDTRRGKSTAPGAATRRSRTAIMSTISSMATCTTRTAVTATTTVHWKAPDLFCADGHAARGRLPAGESRAALIETSAWPRSGKGARRPAP